LCAQECSNALSVSQSDTMDSVGKMTDEKLEQRRPSTVESGYGAGDLDDAVVKKALWKMDVRYASSSIPTHHPLT